MRNLLFAIALLSACGKGDKPPPPTTGTPTAQPETGPAPTTGQPAGGGTAAPAAGGTAAAGDPVAEAKQVFSTVCASCHGVDGTGSGPAAANLDPKPRNYTDPAWQASVTDDDIKKIIVEGGQAVGKSAMMPPNPQLKDKPAVLDELVKLIRSFKQG